MMTAKAELETATVVDQSWTPTREIQIVSLTHGPLGYTHKSLQGYRLNRTRNVIFLLDRSVVVRRDTKITHGLPYAIPR